MKRPVEVGAHFFVPVNKYINELAKDFEIFRSNSGSEIMSLLNKYYIN